MWQEKMRHLPVQKWDFKIECAKTSCEGKRSLSKGKGQKTTRELKLDWSLKISVIKKHLFLIASLHGFSSTHFWREGYIYSIISEGQSKMQMKRQMCESHSTCHPSKRQRYYCLVKSSFCLVETSRQLQNLHPGSEAVYLIMPISLNKWLSLELLCGVFHSNESMSPLHFVLQPSKSPSQLGPALLLHSKSTSPATMEQSTKTGEIHLLEWKNIEKPIF